MTRKTETAEQRACRLQKRLTATLFDVENQIATSRGTFIGEAKIKGFSGNLRVIVRARARMSQCWAMAVLLNNARIDGIDWERVVRDHRGKKHDCSGWHRHIWKPKGGDTNKECLPNFSPSNLREFVKLGLSVLNVKLDEGIDDADGRLQFD